MTEEYKFFKDFAGVTDQDLEKFKCGGQPKVKKMEPGAAITKKTSQKNKPVSKVAKRIDDDLETTYVIDRGKGYIPDTTRVTNNPAIGKKTTEIKTNGKWGPLPSNRATKGRENPRPKKK